MAVSVTQQDIEAQWRPLTDAEAATVSGRAASAWLRILAKVPDVEARMTAGTLAEAVVRDVMVSMLLRVFKNPDGFRSFGGQIDDGQESATVDSALSTGEIYVSADELAMLAPPAVLPAGGFYVVGLGG